LQAIASGKSFCRPNLLLEVNSLITKYSKTVTFVWLPSHIVIKGNELADSLANTATPKPDTDVNIGLELSEAYNMVDRHNFLIGMPGVKNTARKEPTSDEQMKKRKGKKCIYIAPLL